MEKVVFGLDIVKENFESNTETTHPEHNTEK